MAMLARRIDLGVVQQVNVRSVPAEPGTYVLILSPLDYKTKTVRINEEALRSLWSHLTKILYPRAASQLTDRIDTVIRNFSGLPQNLTYITTATPDRNSVDKVIISGLARAGSWNFMLTRTTAEDLWITLEELLDQV